MKNESSQILNKKCDVRGCGVVGCFGVRSRLGRHGFSLLELLAAMAIMAILSGLGIKMVGGFMESSRKSRAKAELSMIQHGLEAYRAKFGDYPRENGTYPTNVADEQQMLFNALNGKIAPDGTAVASRALLDLSSLTLEFKVYPNPSDSASVANRIVDPWGNVYLYSYDPKGGLGWTNYSYVLYSEGRDGASTAVPATGIKDLTAAGNADNLYAE